MERERIKWIDALKGFAALLVVIGHIADGYLNANIYSDKYDILYIIFNFIYSFHMPLFFIISGYLFVKAYYQNEILNKKSIIKQIINLFILFTVFSIFQWCIKIIFSSYVNTNYTIRDLLLMYIYPMAPYWYLYDLIIFYLVAIFIIKNFKKYIKTPIIIFIVIIITLILPFKIELVSSKLYYFLFFYIGMILEKIKFKKIIIAIGTIFSMSLTVFLIKSNIIINQIPGVNMLVAFLTSMFYIYFFKNYKILFENKILNILR